MATRRRATATAEPAADGAGQRRCIGSTKFGIAAHEAPPAEFPAQPSQKDGLGRMCKLHWNQYTSALRKAALARRAAEGDGTCPFGGTTPAECSTTRERSVAGISSSIPDCPTHGAFLEAEPEPAADGSVAAESPGPKARRAKLEAKLAEVGVGSDDGQRILEAAARAARGLAPLPEAVAFD